MAFWKVLARRVKGVTESGEHGSELRGQGYGEVMGLSAGRTARSEVGSRESERLLMPSGLDHTESYRFPLNGFLARNVPRPLPFPPARLAPND